MFPKHAHMVKYDGKYLGKDSYVFGFIKESHAVQVAKNLKWRSPVLKVSPNMYVMNRKPPTTNIKQQTIKPSLLHVQTFDISLGDFFTSVNKNS